MSTGTPPISPRSYSHPRLFHSLGLFGIVFSLGGCLLAAALPLLRPGGDNGLLMILCLGGFGGSLYVSYAMVRRSRDSIAVAADGLRWHSPNRPPVFIGWNEIADVEAQNVLQRLVVTDSGGTRSIPIEYHLEDFGELRRIVLERAGHGSVQLRTGTEVRDVGPA